MTLIFRLEPVIENLPDDFDVMRVEACSEGYRFVERLATDWEAGVTRFDRDEEALVGARVDDVLAGIGGLHSTRCVGRPTHATFLRASLIPQAWLRIPTKSAGDSGLMSATHSD